MDGRFPHGGSRLLAILLFALTLGVGAQPRTEIVEGSDTSVTLRELLPLRVAADAGAAMYHFKGCPRITPAMQWIAPAAATLRGLTAHCPQLRKQEYATRTAARQPRDPNVISVLFLGNSLVFYNEIPGMTLALGAKEKRPLRVDSVTRSGAPLDQLWNETAALRKLWLHHWDYVVIQGGAAGANPLTNTETFNRYLRLFAEETRKSGATPLFYMVWSLTKPAEFEAASFTAAKSVRMKVVPAGVAWHELVRTGRFKRLDWDEVHPDAFGAYLVAATVFSTIYGKPAPAAPYEFRHLAVKNEAYDAALREQRVTPEDARALREAAWRAVGSAGVHGERRPSP